jgi:hypothetical protein
VGCPQAEVGSPGSTVAFVTSVLSKKGKNEMNLALSRLSLDGGGPPLSCAITSARGGWTGSSREQDEAASAAAAERVRRRENRAGMMAFLVERNCDQGPAILSSSAQVNVKKERTRRAVYSYPYTRASRSDSARRVPFMLSSADGRLSESAANSRDSAVPLKAA